MRVLGTLLSALIAFGVNAATISSQPTPDISGTWQGTLQPPFPSLRLAFQISRDLNTWKATMYSIDTTPDQTPVPEVSINGSMLRLDVDSLSSSFQGRLSADGSAFSGTWAIGTRSAPLQLRRVTQATAWPLYNTGYAVQFVAVDHGVKLEVLDWGGSGRPVILLAGLGNTAHVFDRIAPKLAKWYHVYGITRRGFGLSSAPTTGYTVDRLGDDVLTVMDALKIDRPVLIGHSMAGQELSYIGSQDPKKIAGLIYLDAGYGYAFYSPSKDLEVPSVPPDVDLDIDVDQLQSELTQLRTTDDLKTRIALFNQLVTDDLVLIRQDLQAQKRELQAADTQTQSAPLPGTPAAQAIIAGMSKFTVVNSPILAIYADPHTGLPVTENTPSSVAKAQAQNQASVEAQITVLKRYNPSARVVRLARASHYLFISNQAQVLDAVHSFIDTLPSSATAP